MTIQPLPQDSGALAPRGLTLPDQRRIRTALESSTSANTRRAYDQAWRRFVAWAEARGTPALPASPELAAAFLAELAEEGRSVATLRLRKSALAKVHRSAGHPDPTDNEAVRQVLPGLARANGRPQRQAKPLTAEALAAVKATAKAPRQHQGRVRRGESARDAKRRGGVDVALLSVLRDGLLRRSEAAELYIGQAAAQELRAIMPEDAAVVGQAAPVFGLSAGQIGRRVNAAAKAAGLGDGFTGHSGRVGMAQDLAASGVELPELMTAGRWKSSRMPARYTERQAAGRGAVARYYQGRGG